MATNEQVEFHCDDIVETCQISVQCSTKVEAAHPQHFSSEPKGIVAQLACDVKHRTFHRNLLENL